MGFGSKILGANIIDRLYHNLENIIIGKNFSSATLAFFDRGKQFPLVLIDNIDGSIQSVMFPAYSKLQDNPDELRETLRKAVRMSSFVSFSAMTILFVIAPQLIGLFLGKKWMDAVPFLQFYCIICMLFPLQTANLQAFNAVGKSSLYFRLTTLKRVIGTGLLLSSIFRKFFLNCFFQCKSLFPLDFIDTSMDDNAHHNAADDIDDGMLIEQYRRCTDQHHDYEMRCDRQLPVL